MIVFYYPESTLKILVVNWFTSGSNSFTSKALFEEYIKHYHIWEFEKLLPFFHKVLSCLVSGQLTKPVGFSLFFRLLTFPQKFFTKPNSEGSINTLWWKCFILWKLNLLFGSFLFLRNLFSAYIISCNQSWIKTLLEFPTIDYNCFLLAKWMQLIKTKPPVFSVDEVKAALRLEGLKDKTSI